MALKLADTIEEMKGAMADAATDPAPRILHLAADFLVRALARDPEKGVVAILIHQPAIQQLTFAYPPHLAGGNAMPVERDSFAGRVVLGGRPVIENQVANEPHKDFFERIADHSGAVRSIQKMVAAPLIARDGSVLGVVEVSRTGTSPQDAGPDFTSRDGENLAKCCQAFAPFLARACVAAPRSPGGDGGATM